MSTTPAAVGRRQIVPVYGAGLLTAFGAHAVAANLVAFVLGRHDSLLELGLIPGVSGAAEVVSKPVFGAIVDRRGARKVMVGSGRARPVATAPFLRRRRAPRLRQGVRPRRRSVVAGLHGARRGGDRCRDGGRRPLGFARLVASAPEHRLGQTMAAGEVGRELGKAGGPALVGAFGTFGLGAWLAALALPRVGAPASELAEAPVT